LRLAALRAERDELYRIARSGTLTNEVTRTLVREIDLQESRFSAGQHCSRSGAARTRSGIHSWRKIEEAKSGCADFLLKLLKRLALLRGNGEHNQKHRQIKQSSANQSYCFTVATIDGYHLQARGGPAKNPYVTEQTKGRAPGIPLPSALLRDDGLIGMQADAVPTINSTLSIRPKRRRRFPD
jgi:hypothetical protein